MGVRIQELPETTGIKKEDVLIVEDGQGTKKGTVNQLDEALGVSQLKEDLTGLQTVVDSKADKSELAKTNSYLDALYKLNKGQTYDVLEQESESYSVDVPSGAKYMGIDKVGGKSVVWNQIFENTKTNSNGVTITNNSDGSMTINGTITSYFFNIDAISSKNFTGHKYMIVLNIIDNPDNIELSYGHLNQYLADTPDATRGVQRAIYSQDTTRGTSRGFSGFSAGTVFNDVKVYVMEHDLTQMFGAGNEPTIEEFKAMFPADYYPYSKPTIISSQTDRVEVVSADSTVTQQITTGFPVLNSAGSVYDYIDLNEEKLYEWTYIDGNEIKALTEPIIIDIEIPTELTDWLTVEAGGSVTFHNSDEGKRLLIPNKLSFVRKLDEVSV